MQSTLKVKQSEFHNMSNMTFCNISNMLLSQNNAIEHLHYTRNQIKSHVVLASIQY